MFKCVRGKKISLFNKPFTNGFINQDFNNLFIRLNVLIKKASTNELLMLIFKQTFRKYNKLLFQIIKWK